MCGEMADLINESIKLLRELVVSERAGFDNNQLDGTKCLYCGIDEYIGSHLHNCPIEKARDLLIREGFIK